MINVYTKSTKSLATRDSLSGDVTQRRDRRKWAIWTLLRWRWDIHVAALAAARRSITSDLSRVRATGGIISAMPAVISSSRGATEIAAGSGLPGAANTPKYLHIQSLSRSLRRSERRRHVRQRAHGVFTLAWWRLRHANRARSVIK